jgi:Cu/Ag efflux pump CusA
MALAVIGGLIVSTTLSLLVVPAFYVIAGGLADRMRRRPAPSGEVAAPATAEH